MSTLGYFSRSGVMADVEKLVMERRRLQWALLVTGAIWCGAMVLAYSPGFTPGMRHVLHLLCSVFMVIWAVPLFWFVIWQHRVKSQPLAFAAVNDELAIRNHWRAQRASRTVLIASLTLGIVV